MGYHLQDGSATAALEVESASLLHSIDAALAMIPTVARNCSCDLESNSLSLSGLPYHTFFEPQTRRKLFAALELPDYDFSICRVASATCFLNFSYSSASATSTVWMRPSFSPLRRFAPSVVGWFSELRDGRGPRR